MDQRGGGRGRSRLVEGENGMYCIGLFCTKIISVYYYMLAALARAIYWNRLILPLLLGVGVTVVVLDGFRAVSPLLAFDIQLVRKYFQRLIPVYQWK